MNNKLTYDQLSELIAGELEVSNRFTRKFLKELVEAIREGLVSDGKVNISKLGIFELKDVEAREGRDPETGEPITIPAHTKVVFKPYKKVRKRINAPYGELEAEFVDPPNQSPESSYTTAQSAQPSSSKKAASSASQRPPMRGLDWIKRNRRSILGIAGVATALVAVGYGTYRLLRQEK